MANFICNIYFLIKFYLFYFVLYLKLVFSIFYYNLASQFPQKIGHKQGFPPLKGEGRRVRSLIERKNLFIATLIIL